MLPGRGTSGGGPSLGTDRRPQNAKNYSRDPSVLALVLGDPLRRPGAGKELWGRGGRPFDRERKGGGLRKERKQNRGEGEKKERSLSRKANERVIPTSSVGKRRSTAKKKKKKKDRAFKKGG